MTPARLKIPRYIKEMREGRRAEAGEACPYGIDEIGKRCAWLAGHRDRYGKAAA